MNVELKISVPLAKLSVLAAALIATLGAEGASAALGATVTSDKPQPDPKADTSATAEVKSGKGKSKSAAPAAEQATADSKAAASAQASDTAAQQPSPSTGETSQPTADTKSAAKLPAYADTDLPARIMKIVETSKTTGDKTQVEKLKAALAEFGVKSAKDLTPEQVVEFAPKLAAIEAPAEDDDNDIA
jgi:hypothetical protein